MKKFKECKTEEEISEWCEELRKKQSLAAKRIWAKRKLKYKLLH